MATERTFAMVKPDGVKRNLSAEILRRIERKGYRVVGLKLMQIPREVAENHGIVLPEENTKCHEVHSPEGD